MVDTTMAGPGGGGGGEGRGRAVAWEGQGAAGGGWAAAPVGSMGGGVEGQPAKGRV